MIPEYESLFARILAQSPFSSKELVTLLGTAPDRYKDHFIQKRNGRGLRQISQPTAELKFLQRLLVNFEFCNLPVHNAATAYRAEKSIKSHAVEHAKNSYLLKLDFKDFFPSISSDAIKHRLRLDMNYSETELWMLCQILCRRDRLTNRLQLSIGAPSSPFLSNYIMWEFDCRIQSYCDQLGVSYTRYADDLAFSTSAPHVLDVVHEYVERLLRELSYLGISLNKEKTVNVSKKNRRSLVGLVLSNSGNVSIGRAEKRNLRAAMHALINNKLTQDEAGKLRGKMAFLLAIDPDFVNGLCVKYNFTRVADIQATNYDSSQPQKNDGTDDLPF